jgi:hypothetical protein
MSWRISAFPMVVAELPWAWLRKNYRDRGRSRSILGASSLAKRRHVRIQPAVPRVGSSFLGGFWTRGEGDAGSDAIRERACKLQWPTRRSVLLRACLLERSVKDRHANCHLAGGVEGQRFQRGLRHLVMDASLGKEEE